MFRIKSVRRGIAAVITVACAGFLGLSPVRGLAQTAPIPAPPEVTSVDANGVDLTSGKMSVRFFEVGIGGSGSGLSRTSGTYGDNFAGAINGSASSSLTVSFRGGSETFNLVSGVWQSSRGSGNTLTCSGTVCNYTLSDGTVAAYDTTLRSFALVRADYATLTSITKPDGEIVTLHYVSQSVAAPVFPNTLRQLSTVTSSQGWMLKIGFAGDDPNTYQVKITAINTSVDYCDPIAMTCPGPSETWPSATVSSYDSPTNMLGHKTVYTGGLSSPTSIVTPSGITTTISYYSSGLNTGRVHQVNKGSSTWTYNYSHNGSGLWTNTVQNPSGGVRTIVFDEAKSQIVSDTSPLGRKVTYKYYAITNSSGAFKGAVSQVINPDATFSGPSLTGGYTQYAYDARGNVTSTTSYPKGGGTPVINRATYPVGATVCVTNPKTCNKPLTVTDANGVTTVYTYHAGSGNIATVTQPTQSNGIAPQTRYTYSQITPHSYTAPGVLSAQPQVWRLTETSTCMTGQAPTCIGTTDENKTTISYGASNTNPTYKNVLPVSQTVSLGNGTLAQTATFTYDNKGNVTSVDGPKPGAVDTTYYFYDALNREFGMIGPDPDGAGSRPRPARRMTFDNDGRVSTIEVGTVTGTNSSALAGMTVVTRDVTTFDPITGLPSVSKNYIGTDPTPQGLTQLSYDASLRVDCVAVRRNPANYSSLPAACTYGAVGPDGARDDITKYVYDADGALLNQQNPVVTRYEVRNTYNSTNGALTSVTDANGNVTGYYYDNFNRLLKTCYPQAGSGGTVNLSDCDQVSYGTVTVGGVTQAATRPSGRTLRDSQSVSILYDGLGRVSSLTGAVSETYGYNNFSQVTTKTNNTSGGPGAPSATGTYSYNALGWLNSDAQPSGTVSYQYDAYGRRSRMTWPDGFYVTYSYTDGDEVVGIFENGSTQIAGFGYDAYGRRNSLTRPNGVNDSYGFDSALRLQTKAMPAIGGSNTITLGYNRANQLTSRTHSNSSYAPPLPTLNQTTTYSVNGLNRITTAGPSTLAYDGRGNMTSDGAITYSYNANNLLVSSSNGASLVYDAVNRLQSYTAGGATTKFLYDGFDLIAEYNGSTLLRRYVHGPGVDEPLVWYEGSGTGTKRYLMADERGSIVGVTNSAGGVLAVNTYDAYGVPASSNNSYAGRFRYTGQVYLQELGIYYYKARMYAPTLGRFMQTDPIGYADGLNWYAYVGNDPMNRRDPTGMKSTLKNSNCGNDKQPCPYSPSEEDIETVIVEGCRRNSTVEKCRKGAGSISFSPMFYGPMQYGDVWARGSRSDSKPRSKAPPLCLQNFLER